MVFYVGDMMIKNLANITLHKTHPSTQHTHTPHRHLHTHLHSQNHQQSHAKQTVRDYDERSVTKRDRNDPVVGHPVGDDEPEHMEGTKPLSGIKIVQKTIARTRIILKKVKMERDEAK